MFIFDSVVRTVFNIFVRENAELAILHIMSNEDGLKFPDLLLKYKLIFKQGINFNN